MKKIALVLVTSFTLLALCAIPTFAQESTSTVSTQVKGRIVTAKSRLDKNYSANQLKVQLQKAERDLKRYEGLAEKFKGKADDAIEKAQVKADKFSKELVLKEKAWQESLDKIASEDNFELVRLNQEIEKWKVSTDKLTAQLNDNIAKIDSNLKETLADLDKQIAAAKDDATKTALAAKKVTAQANADARKAAINKYITTLKAIWADKQKMYDMRKDILTRRQAADTEFKTTMQNIRKSELTASGKLSKTDAATTAKYQKQIDDYTKKIAELQKLIDQLKAKIAAQTTTSTSTATTTTTATSTN